VKESQSGDTGSGKHHLFYRIAIVDDQASGDRLRDFPALPQEEPGRAFAVAVSSAKDWERWRSTWARRTRLTAPLTGWKESGNGMLSAARMTWRR
jgi:hypothetical protein